MSKALTPEAIADALECARCFTPECEHHPGSFSTFEAALEAVNRIRRVHEGYYSTFERRDVCAYCDENWPCPTIAALEGPNE